MLTQCVVCLKAVKIITTTCDISNETLSMTRANQILLQLTQPTSFNNVSTDIDLLKGRLMTSLL